MKKLLQFDFDGVIVNTLDMIMSVNKDLGQETTKEEYVKLFQGNFFKNLEKVQKKKYTREGQDLFFNLYGPRLLELSPTPGIIDTIVELSKNHRLVIISSTTNNPIEQYLVKHDLDTYFDAIYGADVHKSKVEKITMALKEHNTSQTDAIYITDTLGDIEEARTAGVDSVAVTWGFHDLEALMVGQPRYVVNDAKELAVKLNEFSAV